VRDSGEQKARDRKTRRITKRKAGLSFIVKKCRPGFLAKDWPTPTPEERKIRNGYIGVTATGSPATSRSE